MGGRIIFPICAKDKCFACENGRCRTLISNNFHGRPCPFYKTAKQLELEEKRRTLREELKGARIYE